MLEKRFNRGNAYFDTYYIRDTENDKFIGIIEDHCRGVKRRYFVGWKFKNNHFTMFPNECGKTKTCNTYEEALEYIQENFEL